MDARTLRACAENQRNAAKWAQRAREWRDVCPPPALCNLASPFFSGAARHFAIQDQQAAAQLSRADRLLRGLEA